MINFRSRWVTFGDLTALLLSVLQDVLQEPDVLFSRVLRHDDLNMPTSNRHMIEGVTGYKCPSHLTYIMSLQLSDTFVGFFFFCRNT